MLGDDLVAALPGLQAQAESMMRDTVRITREGAEVFDPDTGTYTPSVTTIYEGKCRLVLRSSVVQDVDAQSQLLALQGPRLDVPVAGTGGVLPDDLFELLSGDGAGLTGRVAGVFPQSLKTARRLPVQIGS